MMIQKAFKCVKVGEVQERSSVQVVTSKLCLQTFVDGRLGRRAGLSQSAEESRIRSRACLG